MRISFVSLIADGTDESMRPAQCRTGLELQFSPADQALAVSVAVSALTLSKQELQ
jgi:hypothetical protein